MPTAIRSWTLALLACCSSAACVTESHSQIAGPKAALVTRTLPTRGWELRDDGRLAGTVLLYSDPERAQMDYYSIRNAEGQVLGLVDLAGRAWRYRLHEEEPEWLGTGTVLEGARRILGTSALSLLEEAELASLVGER
jgi:hypothetical protein